MPNLIHADALIVFEVKFSAYEICVPQSNVLRLFLHLYRPTAMQLFSKPDLYFRSSNAAVAVRRLKQVAGSYEIIKYDDRFRLHYSGYRLGTSGSTVGVGRLGSKFVVADNNRAPTNTFRISLPLKGEQILLGTPKAISNRDSGLILNPRMKFELFHSDGCEKIHLVFDDSKVQGVLSELLNQSVVKPVEFDPIMDAINGAAGSWWRWIKYMMTDFGRGQSIFMHPELSANIEKKIIKGLLFSQPNNYSHRLNVINQKQIPDYLSKVKQFIHCNAKKKITLQALLDIARVTPFRLHEDFKRYFGITPMSYLKNYRLESIRRDILRDGAQAYVSSIALDWQITHLGRFSADYKRFFGELPTETLRRKLRQRKSST